MVVPPSSKDEPLFESIKVGNVTLAHPSEYYGQRASVPGTLLIAEATFIAAKAGGYEHIPGIWNQAQIDAWKKVTDAVHARGSFIFLQLWSLARAAYKHILLREGFTENDYVSASNVRLAEHDHDSRPLTIAEIREYAQYHAHAARIAIETGFDGVEIHGANGYLIDQFIQDVSNTRTDEYGGSIENRSRFALEMTEAVVGAIGQKRTGIRFSPWSDFQVFSDMRMADPIPTFSHLIITIRDTYPDFAYIHLIDLIPSADSDKSKNDFAIWGGRPYISNEQFTRSSALRWARTKGDIVAFGTYFLADPTAAPEGRSSSQFG